MSEFDYEALDTVTRATVRTRENELKDLKRDTERNLREIGLKLADIRALLRYKSPGFVAWCAAKNFPTTTAYRLINLATKPKMFPGAENILMLASLSEPQTPDEARMMLYDAAGSDEIIEAIEQDSITNNTLAMAATNDPTPKTILVNAAGEVAEELIASGHVTLRDGTQIKPTPEAVIPALHAAMSERAARQGQHKDEYHDTHVTLPTNDIEEAARRILDNFAPDQIATLLTILSSAVAEAQS